MKAISLIRILGVSAALGFLLSCGAPSPDDAGGGSRLLANSNEPARNGRGSAIQRFRDALETRGGSQRRVGTDAFISLPNQTRDLVEVSSDGAFTLNLVEVPVEEAARAVLGTALRRNFTIQPDVTGSFTLQTSRPLNERELLETFQAVLELNGATLQVSGDLLTILPIASSARRVAGANDLGAIGSRIAAVPLKYIGTAEMIRLLDPIVGQSISLQPIAQRNILLISGTRDEINAALEAINLFDVDVLQGKSVGLFKLRAATPEAVVEELNLIFETGDGGSLQNVVTFVPSTRLAAVLVISSRSRYLAEAERWIRDLDRTAGGAQRRPVVYSLQNRSAEDLAPILSEMIGDVADAENVVVEGTPKVVSDDTKNAVIVWGNDAEQERFSRLIAALDTVPVQVLLEATIAEVTLNDQLDFGLRWFFESGRLRGTFTDAASGSVGPSFPGLSFVFQGPSAAVALNALNSVTDVEVVSSPSLLVLDNQEASLQIGDQVPIATQQVLDTSNPNAPVVNTISFRDTGIILTVEPRVSQTGQVVLDIEQEVSSVQNTTTSGIDSPTISQRRIETSVVVGDGQTIALGGLIEEGRNRNNAKVPGAGDIPILGGLFRNRSDSRERTELLVLITPRVVRNGAESREVTAELRDRIRRANGLVQNGISSTDVGHRIIE